MPVLTQIRSPGVSWSCCQIGNKVAVTTIYKKPCCNDMLLLITLLAIGIITLSVGLAGHFQAINIGSQVSLGLMIAGGALLGACLCHALWRLLHYSATVDYTKIDGIHPYTRNLIVNIRLWDLNSYEFENGSLIFVHYPQLNRIVFHCPDANNLRSYIKPGDLKNQGFVLLEYKDHQAIFQRK